jgi:hypothetical protein
MTGQDPMNEVSERKIARIPVTWLDWLMEAISLLGLISLWIMTSYYHGIESAKVPEDFSFLKNPSYYWASNMTYTIPLIATVIYLYLTYMKKRPIPQEHLIEVNPEKEAKILQINNRLMRWIKIVAVSLFIMIEFLSYNTGSNQGTGISYMVIFFLPILMVGPIIYFLFEFSKSQLT